MRIPQITVYVALAAWLLTALGLVHSLVRRNKAA
jgi:hypothetical protein